MFGLEDELRERIEELEKENEQLKQHLSYKTEELFRMGQINESLQRSNETLRGTIGDSLNRFKDMYNL